MKNCPVCHHESVILERDGYWRCQNCDAYQKRTNLIDKIGLWAVDRSLLLRLVLTTLIILLLIKLLQNPLLSLSGFANPFGYLDLGFHELGHIVFLPLGEFMTIAGGSIFQVLMPLLWFGAFIYSRWFFASVMCIAWLGSSLIGVSVYARDAYLLELPLVSLGNIGDSEASGHDWDYLFSHTGSLDYQRIMNDADFLKHLGVAALILSIVLAVALLITIAVMKRKAHARKKHVALPKAAADGLYPTATRGVMADYEKESEKENRPDSSQEE